MDDYCTLRLKRNEKTYLKRLLLPKSNGKLGALRDIWNLCDVYTEDEINENEWLKAASKNPAFDFLKDPEEVIYLNP